MRFRSITAAELLHIPLLTLTVMTTLQTPYSARAASPIYHRMDQIMPLDWWLLGMAVTAAVMVAGLLLQRVPLTILGYVLVATLWLTVAGLVYDIARTFQTPLIYAFVGASAIYRAADLWVQWREPARAGPP